MRALALDAAGEHDAARACLADTLRRAAPLGFIRTFLDRGPRLRALLEQLAVKRPGDAYIESLLGAFGAAERPDGTREAQPSRRAESEAGATSAAPLEDLTNRERDVLELLAARLSNKEIAERLSVSAETVKKHNLNLYRKLHVEGRRQAVAAALARGLIRRSS